MKVKHAPKAKIIDTIDDSKGCFGCFHTVALEVEGMKRRIYTYESGTTGLIERVTRYVNKRGHAAKAFDVGDANTPIWTCNQPA